MLQGGAGWCRVLQCVAERCSEVHGAGCWRVLQCVAAVAHCLWRHHSHELCSFYWPPSVLQCVAVRCSAVQCGAVRCGVLQGVAVCCSVLWQSLMIISSAMCAGSTPSIGCPVRYGVLLQCVAVCCRVVQGVAMCCNVLQCVAAIAHDLWEHHSRGLCSF